MSPPSYECWSKEGGCAAPPQPIEVGFCGTSGALAAAGTMGVSQPHRLGARLPPSAHEYEVEDWRGP